jgi:hypothetical protein
VLRARERALIPSPSVVFTFRFTVESIKELEGASLTVLGKTKNQPTLVYTIVKIDFILIHCGRLFPFEFDKINDVMMMKPANHK